VFPFAVTLQGSYGDVPSHSSFTGAPPTDGTVLLPYAGRGNINGQAFLFMQEDCSLKGLVIYYPEQPFNDVPVPYPWTINMTGNNPAVVDVELLNPFNAIYAVQASRHYLARIQGQAINTGIFVDQTYDIGRIEDVHWNPYWSQDVHVTSWQALNGRAFVIARSDWEYVLNTFAFGYAIGYHFLTSSDGSMNGNFLGIGMDLAYNASIRVDGAQPMGILITNGEFTAFDNKDYCPSCNALPTQVFVSSSNTGPSNSGPIRFVNSAFWGPTDYIALLEGTNLVGFSDCEFVNWDADNKGYPAIQANQGSIIVTGCDFQQNSAQIIMESAVTKAVILGNVIKGKANIVSKSSGNIQMGYNADDSKI